MSDGVFESRIKVQQIIQNQLPEFILEESPKAVDFLRQYYISQEFQSGPTDILENLDQYLKLDNFTKEVISGFTILSSDITNTSDTIFVESTKGFPSEYGLLKIDEEIITYTSKTSTSFIGCVRGFSGITDYRQPSNPQELIFKISESDKHESGAKVINLSSLFLKEFYKKIKFTFTPGLEDVDFVPDLKVNNFIKEARSLYQSKGTEDSFKILFKVLYNEDPKVIDLEQYLLKPSAAEYIRREIIVAEKVSGNPLNLVGQTIKRYRNEYTQASVSEVETITRKNRVYYKLGLFVGYNEKEFIDGEFDICGKTKILEDANVGDTVISVDSTIGFDSSGIIIAESDNNINYITYTEKTVNQFLGCSGIETKIPLGSDIYADDLMYGYENGDPLKKVEIKITGVLNNKKFIPSNDNIYSSRSDKIYYKHLGDYIENSLDNPSYKQIFANSWIYNTSCRYELNNFTSTTSILTLKTELDKTSLDVGDFIDIVERESGQVKSVSPHKVITISLDKKNITIFPAFTPEEFSGSIGKYKNYDIRRKIKKSFSSNVAIQYGNDKIVSNVQNLYVDKNSYAYVTSNSLPEYQIDLQIISALSSGSPNLEDFNPDDQSFSTIRFTTQNVPFITGDIVFYHATNENDPIKGLKSGSKYYVSVISNNTIKLYFSKSSIEIDDFIKLRYPSDVVGDHRFTLEKDASGLIKPQKNLKKFPLFQDIANGSLQENDPGASGMLINGVEIISPKSKDKIYYGPIKSLNILNSGNNYDVVNPPKISINSPENGTQALAQPVVRGFIQNILVDPQDFDITGQVYVSISGGNSSGSVLKPIISKRYRTIEFDGRLVQSNGGIDSSAETITFNSDHNLSTGEFITYDSNGNDPIGVGTYGGSDVSTGLTLVNNSKYCVSKVNSKTIRLHNSLSDAISGINTIGFTTTFSAGFHKFKTEEKFTLTDILVSNPGSEFENRKLYLKQSGISSESDYFRYDNHNFSDGDVVVYSYEPSGNPISGLSTTTKYKILKVDENIFKLSDIGSSGENNYNYISRKNVEFTSTGSGYQIIQYPPISITVSGSFNSENKTITATPVIRGEIVDFYLYETGSGYGSTILNFEKKPIIRISNGKDAEIFPVISNGQVVSANVSFGGYDYNSTPDLIVQGSGSGAVLRAVISDEKIVNVVVIKSGSGYDSSTKIIVKSAGSGAIVESRVRDLSINDRDRYGNNEILLSENNGLKYGVISYPREIASSYLKDYGNNYSPIIGWAYDGNPIYGPYAPSDPTNLNSELTIVKSGYVLDKSKLFDRPNVSDNTTFIEDYVFTDSGDLDEHNGRFAKTLEFPKGIYAYYATIDDITLEPTYPYFIGNTYKSKIIDDNLLSNINQEDYDLNNSGLIRNTFPYRVSSNYVNNEFISESTEIFTELASVESVSRGSVQSFDIISPGNGYKVGENLIFDDSETGGGGVSAKVSEVQGSEIVSIASSTLEYINSSLFWSNNQIIIQTPSTHDIQTDEFVTISGITTYIKNALGSHKVTNIIDTTNLIIGIPTSTAGIVTDIYLTYIPKSLKPDSKIVIGEEELQVLNIFNQDSIVRVKRGDDVFHPSRSEVKVLPDSLVIPLKTDYFVSTPNEKVYFNPKFSVGVGTIPGVGISTSFNVGITTKTVDIPTQSIYLPDHKFTTGQQVLFTKGSSTISVSNTTSSPSFTLPLNPSNDSQILYIINKSKDFVGVTTSIGLTTNTNGLFFIDNGTNDYEYSIESQNPQVKCDVSRIKATISVSTDHNLNINDIVRINVVSNSSTGIGSSDKIRVYYNEQYKKTLLNPVGFTSSSIDEVTNVINIQSHGFITGDKVFYDVTSGQTASGLSTGSYYVYKLDNDNIQLGNTLYDVSLIYPNIVNISSRGGNYQRLSLINPQILAIKNSNLIFDVSDSSLSDYKFNIFYDEKFYNKFTSTSNQSDFNVISIGSSVIINYSNDIPQKLYYNISKNGINQDADLDVKNYNQIFYVDSNYNGSYNVIGIGTTTFSISLEKSPEINSYIQNVDCTLEYFTKTQDITGPVSRVSLLSGGSNYKKIPTFVKINSNSGVGANIVPISKNIGVLNDIRLSQQTFNYPSDKTLSPSVDISTIAVIKDSNTISNIEVINGGSNYILAPNLKIYDVDNDTIVDDSSLEAIVTSGSITSVYFNKMPYGLKDSTHKIIATNNSNGIGVEQVNKITNTVYDFILTTPISGYTSNVFEVGDRVFVEGTKIIEGSGTGLNSSDYGYSYFEVQSFSNTVPAVVRVDFSEFTDNGGTVDVNTEFTFIVNKVNYPEFSITQTKSTFLEGEELLVNDGFSYKQVDLFVKQSNPAYINVLGSYTPKDNQLVKGKTSGVIGTIDNVSVNSGKFEINYSTNVNYGWSNDIGKLSETYQVCPDNDYYQNLSYTVKSKIQFNEMIDPVNRLLHSSGLKNFADTEVISTSKVGIGSTSSDISVLDVLEENRVDTIYNFDLGLDVNSKGNRSKNIKIRNRKLADYFKCLTNRVLVVDDISQFFDDDETNKGLVAQQFTEIGSINSNYTRFLIQIINPITRNIELSEIIAMTKNDNIFILEKGSLNNLESKFGNFVGIKNSEDQNTLRFIPENIYDYDYDIKILSTEFNNIIFANENVNIGCVDLYSYKNTVAVGQTYTISSFDKQKYDTFFAQVHTLNTSKNISNYVEIFASHNGSDVSYAEYYFDDDTSVSQNFIGRFTPNIISNQFNLDFYNNTNSSVIVSLKVVGFGSTALGEDVYRFKTNFQNPGEEKSALLQSNYSSGTSTVNVLTLDKNDFSSAKSLIKVSYGQTSAMHQVMLVHNDDNTYTLEYPYVSVGSTSGIGTFGSIVSGSNVILRFYADSNVSDTIKSQSYSEIFYEDWDADNIPLDLLYNPITESFKLQRFNALNGSRINRLSFDLRHKNDPIFAKTFVPQDVLDLSTGIFSIKNHFFSSGEKVFYSANTTVGTATPIKINPSYSLPSQVYVHVLDQNNFGISTTKSNALSGIYVTFTSYGTGNAHEFEMEKKNEKCIISIDGTVQQPLTYTPIIYVLTNNGGSISAATTYFAVSGISTVKNGDFLKVDDEFMKVTSVGFGTTSVGPVLDYGSYNVMNVERGFFETIPTTHSDGTQFRIYKGSFNIIGNKINFANPPRGGGRDASNESNLIFPSAYFSGRVYLQSDYDNNKIYDDISSDFTGIGRTFTLKSSNQNITGIGTGNGFIFINDIFQTPSTVNNSDNDFEIVENETLGISSVTFSGITTTIGTPPIVVNYDINRNDLPRGGIVISLGSTTGLGFAPLVDASVTAVVGAGGSIVSVGVGSTNIHGSGYNRQVSVAITDSSHTGTAASIRANIGVGGTLSFTVISGGSGYTNPKVIVSSPSYENLPVVGVSRVGIGSTTITGKELLLNLSVGASSTTGIGSGYYEVKSFSIINSGYDYKVGDVIRPVGLVTDSRIASPLIPCEFTVTSVFNDSFYGMQLGEFDYIDSIKSLQDGIRTVFPILYNGEVRSLEIDNTNPLSNSIDLQSCLLIFVNGVIQEPELSYVFTGGTTFRFIVPPKPEDEISIFFYQGRRGIDVLEENINETIKSGDTIQLLKNSLYTNTVSQGVRVVDIVKSSDELVTNVYDGLGIDEQTYKPLSWTKQKVDRVIGGQKTYKSRDSLEPLVFPTANIIKNFGANDSEVFIDNSDLFRIDSQDNMSSIIIPNSDENIIPASFSATVNEIGQVSSVSITNSGFGYTESSLPLKFSNPYNGIGIGTISATGTVNIVNGSVSSVAISSGGVGYSSSFPPQCIIQSPKPITNEVISGISSVKGFSGVVAGVSAVSVGSSYRVIFDIKVDEIYNSWMNTLLIGYPLYVYDTSIGSPRSSLDINDKSVVGIGTTYLDNIYIVHRILSSGISTAAVESYVNSSLSGISTYIGGNTFRGIGKFSWGSLNTFSRGLNPKNINVKSFTVTSGLSTFPVIQRRASGLRNTGGVAFAKT